MRKNKIVMAIVLSAGLTIFTAQATAAIQMGYSDSTEYVQYRDEQSAYKLRASDIIGSDVENAQGEEVGEVDDLIVSRKDNKLMAIISTEGFLGVNEHQVSVPYEDLRIGKEGEKIYWNVSKKSLEAMPAFEYGEGEAGGNERMSNRWNSRKAGAEGTVTKMNATSAKRVGYDQAVDYTKYRSDDSGYILRVSDMLGEDIENADGDNIGEVDDLIIPRDDDDLQAVVSVGGFLGIGDRLVSIPYSELRVAGDGDEFYLNVGKKELESKPVFKYNEGERTGTEMLNERKRFVAEVREDLNESTQEMKQETAAAVKEVKQETAAIAGSAATTFKDSVGYADVRQADSPYHLRMSEIIGEDVENADGDEIGEIDDLIMSRDNDSLMAIISVGGFLGIGDKLVSVPYKELRMSADGDDIYLDSSKEMLKSQPEFKYNEGEGFGKDTLRKKMNDDN